MDEASELAALHAFLRRFAADRDGGTTLPLPAYVAMWPEHAAAIEREHAELVGATTAEPEDGPQQIGPYRIVRPLGRGGQATVYLAHDARLSREVALKVLPRAFASAQQELRLRREATTAARLDDSGICPVYEVGQDGAHAYLAMRYVPGETLEERLTRARNGEPLPWREVAMLFVRLADSLQRAHAAGIVHRDIKPGNVMLGADGQPVLLDFGLAVETEDAGPLLTRSGDLFGTPAYLPPERLLGHSRRADPRWDLWALGVCLYEALTLQRPFAAPTLDGLYRAILGETPPAAGHHVRGLPRDLQTVAAVCLEKAPERRYQSAADFAADLRAVLAGEPIRAKPPGLLRRVQRWHARSAPLAIALWMILLGLGAVIAVQRTMLAEVRAANNESTQLNDFLIEKMLLATLPDRARGHEPTAAEVLDAAAANVHAAFATPSRVGGMLLHVLGRAQGTLGRRTEAEQAFARAVAMRTAVLGPHARQTLQSRFELCRIRRELDRIDEAAAELDIVLELQTDLFGDDDDDTLNSRSERVAQWLVVGRNADAEHEAAAIAAARGRRGEGTRQHLEALHQHARCLSALGRRAEAEPALRAVLAGRRTLLGPDAVGVERSLSELATLLHDRASYDRVQEKWRQAEQCYAEQLELARRIYKPTDPSYATAVNNFATFWQDRATQTSDPAEVTACRERAEAMFRESLALREAANGPDSTRVATVANNLGMLLLQSERYDEAMPMLQRSIEIQTRVRGELHTETLKAVQNLGHCTLMRDGPAAAVPIFADALERARRRADREPRFIGMIENAWLRTLLVTEDAEAGLPHCERAFADACRFWGAQSREATLLAARTAAVLRKLGRDAEAVPWQERAGSKD